MHANVTVERKKEKTDFVNYPSVTWHNFSDHMAVPRRHVEWRKLTEGI